MGPRIKPDYAAVERNTRPAVYLCRAAAAHLRAFVTNNTPEREARELFGDDGATEIVLRAPTTPAAISGTSGWAASLAGIAIYDLVQTAASLSAAADIINRGLKLNMDGIAEYRVPGRVLNAAAAGPGGGSNALSGDLGNLFAALAAHSGGKTAVIIAALPQAVKLKLTAGPKFDYDIIASTALPTGTVAVLEIASFVSGFGSTAEFNTTKVGALHMEDTGQGFHETREDRMIRGLPWAPAYQARALGKRPVSRSQGPCCPTPLASPLISQN